MELKDLIESEIKVLQSSFIQSAQKTFDVFSPYCTEIAILGRSNVGKSSIINLLLNHKLAKSSSTPGKTRLINFFSTTWEIISKDKSKLNSNIRIPFIIIDFPGFGYAKVSKNEKKMWDRNLTDFINKRQNIKLFCHLIDSRHTNLDIDSKIDDFLHEIICNRKDCKILKIYTKEDKLSKNELYKLKDKLTISTLKKSYNSTQNLYKSILQYSFDLT